MARAATIPGVAGGHSLTQKIALSLKRGPAFILVTGCDTASRKIFLENLSAALLDAGRIINLHLPSSCANLSDQVADAIGLDLAPASAISLAKHLDGNTHLLCSTTKKCSPDVFEQLRQLSNLQPKSGYLSITLCSHRTLSKQLPNALRQRVTATYRLDETPPTLRNAVWGVMLSILGASAWLAHDHLPNLFGPTVAIQPQLDSKPVLETSLRAGPVLAQPVPAEEKTPLTHVFQTETEAEAALQAQEPVEKPYRE